MYANIHSDIRTKTYAELEAIYGVEIDEYGTVWDDIEGREFHDLTEWADFCVSQEK